MTLNVVDLAQVREARASMRALVGELEQGLIALATTQAARAFAVSGPLMASDPTMARGVNQWVRRQLRRATRKMLRDLYKRPVVDDVVDQVSYVFRNTLIALSDEVEAACGTAVAPPCQGRPVGT